MNCQLRDIKNRNSIKEGNTPMSRRCCDPEEQTEESDIEKYDRHHLVLNRDHHEENSSLQDDEPSTNNDHNETKDDKDDDTNNAKDDHDDACPLLHRDGEQNNNNNKPTHHDIVEESQQQRRWRRRRKRLCPQILLLVFGPLVVLTIVMLASFTHRLISTTATSSLSTTNSSDSSSNNEVENGTTVDDADTTQQQQQQQQQQNNSNTGTPKPNMECAHQLGIDFEQFMKEIATRTFWCQKNTSQSCPCTNPLAPTPRDTTPWYQAHEQNVASALNATTTTTATTTEGRENMVDVVFLGDSIMEFWKGTFVGKPVGGLDGVVAVFKSLFTKEGGGDVEALPLGISMDKCPQLLWRIRNGEIPDNLEPKVWWVLIGTNDLGNGCSTEGTLAGIIQIVQEIRLRRPNAIIVVNGILPRGRGILSLDEGIWKEISWINDRISCYCGRESNIEFLNSTNVFLDENGTRVDKALMNDFLHPSADGYRKWGEQILEKLKDLGVSKQKSISTLDMESKSTSTSPVTKGNLTLHCTRYFNASFEQLTNEIANATRWCTEDFSDQSSCRCLNPLEPHERVPSLPGMFHNWDRTHKMNVKAAETAKENTDVVFVGDSITEHWRGTDLGVFDSKYDDIASVFKELFTREGGGQFEGLPLGIGGDRCPQLLWRLQNGEMPDNLEPKVWWVLIGTNDLGGDHCSPKSVLVGTIRIVEEIQHRRPDAVVVVNSILPKPNNRPGAISVNEGLWKEISWINDRLRCYCEGHEDVRFFNATDIFLNEDGTSIEHSLMPDHTHPSGAGSQIWGEKIVDKLTEISSGIIP